MTYTHSAAPCLQQCFSSTWSVRAITTAHDAAGCIVGVNGESMRALLWIALLLVCAAWGCDGAQLVATYSATSPTPAQTCEPATTVSAPSVGLPSLPTLTNVCVVQREDSVGIEFDPVDGAVDYRVYPLPAPGDVTVNPDGTVTIPNAIYRCAGRRQTWDLRNDQNADAGLNTANGSYDWTATIGAAPMLGSVYVQPRRTRAGVRRRWIPIAIRERLERKPLQGLHDGCDPASDPGRAGWARRGDRVLRACERGHDDAGLVYFFTNIDDQGSHQIFYFGASDAAAHMSDATPPAMAFPVLAASTTDSQPLYAMLYSVQNAHTVLSVGRERFNRAANQGDGPLWHLEWSGLTQPTTLVVEALASGCPFQGFLAAQHLGGNASGGAPEQIAAPPHQTFYTLADLQTASATGEVFVNGQFDTTMFPQATARSFIQVSPQPHDPTAWDWYQGFSDNSAFDPVNIAAWADCHPNDPTCGRWQTSVFDFTGFSLDAPNGVSALTYGSFLGEMWVAFDDTGQGTPGRLRFTATQSAFVVQDPQAFVHVTWSVNVEGDDSRYPQMILSDQPAPVQTGFANPDQNTLSIQPYHGPSMRLEVDAIHGLVGVMPGPDNFAPAHVPLSGYNSGDNADDGRASPTPCSNIRGVIAPRASTRMCRHSRYTCSWMLAGGLHTLSAGVRPERTGDRHVRRRHLS